MDWDERVELAHNKITGKWYTKFKSIRGPALAKWVSSFRNGMPCKIIGDHCGSFNWSCSVCFDDDVKWLVRFAMDGRVMERDEKLRREVAVMQLVRESTTIPVPKIHAWGLSTDNALGLGPFIVMDYVAGEPLGNICRKGPNMPSLRSDIRTRELRKVYRQIAGFYLELEELEFPNIGSLAIRPDQSIHPDLGPLTLKMQEIEAHAGLKVGGDRSTTFSSATDYFHSVADQDMEHLSKQPSSVDNADDARTKYKNHQQLKAIIPRFVDDEHDRSGFRLICDDFRYGNMIVNNAEELKIIAVVDWEWTYTAPYQMFCSAPRWLLITNPIFWGQPDGTESHQYKACLKIFLEELRREENKRDKVTLQGGRQTRLSDLMRKSLTDGKFWFHELIYDCYTGANNPAWQVIFESHPDAEELTRIDERELDEFVARKLKEREVYTEEWNAITARIKRKNTSSRKKKR